MSRSLFHKMINELSGSFLTFHTSFSGAMSLAAPGAGEHLRIYSVDVEGPSAMLGSTAVSVDIDGAAVGLKYFDGGKTRPFAFLGRYLKANTGLEFTRPDNNKEVVVSVLYRQVSDDAI